MDDPAITDDPVAEAPAPPAAPTTPAAAVPGRTLLIVALVTSLIVAAGLAVLAAGLQGRLHDERQERDDIARVAGSMAAALLTYDYEDLDTARDRVLSLSTGKFRSEYRNAFSGLQTLLREAKASSKGSVTDVYVSDADASAASAIVAVNTVAEGAAGRRATVASYIQLDLVRVDGRWLVDGVTNLNFGGAPVDLSPSSTTVPGSP